MDRWRKWYISDADRPGPHTVRAQEASPVDRDAAQWLTRGELNSTQ